LTNRAWFMYWGREREKTGKTKRKRRKEGRKEEKRRKRLKTKETVKTTTTKPNVPNTLLADRSRSTVELQTNRSSYLLLWFITARILTSGTIILSGIRQTKLVSHCAHHCVVYLLVIVPLFPLQVTLAHRAVQYVKISRLVYFILEERYRKPNLGDLAFGNISNVFLWTSKIRMDLGR